MYTLAYAYILYIQNVYMSCLHMCITLQTYASHANLHTWMHAHIHINITCMHAFTCTPIHPASHTNWHICMHVYTFILHVCMHSRIHTYIQHHIQTYMHACTYTHLLDMYTHTHTYIQLPVPCLFPTKPSPLGLPVIALKAVAHVHIKSYSPRYLILTQNPKGTLEV